MRLLQQKPTGIAAKDSTGAEQRRGNLASVDFLPTLISLIAIVSIITIVIIRDSG